MTDDLVRRLRESAEEWDDCEEAHNAFQDREAADRIQFLEAALWKIHMLSEARSRHAWDDHATYYRISTDALDGKKSDE